MKTNHLKFPLYIFSIALFQIMINSSFSKIYLDLLGLIIVILILSSNYNFKSLIIVSIIADLIGHWYLGTHIIAAVILTFVSTNITTFFSISSFLHKCIMLMFFSLIFLFIIFIIDFIVHNTVISTMSFVIEIVIFVPLLLKLLEKTLTKNNQDIIF